MYEDVYSEELVRKLARLRKKDPEHYSKVRKKINSVLANPRHRYKFLHHDMKGINRVHIGHFVLVFVINHAEKTVSFDDYDHHDNIYAR